MKELSIEEKELLLKDLSARLPYGVICKVEFKDSESWKIQNMSLEGAFINECYFTTDTGSIYSKKFKPYLRSLSSMTEREHKDIIDIDMKRMIFSSRHLTFHIDGEVIDYLNRHMVDWRHLISKGLAIEAPEGIYNIK